MSDTPKGNRITSETARETGRKGGKASGVARRLKRTMREWAEIVRDAPAPDEIRARFPGMTNAGAAVVAMFTESMSGNVSAFRALAELMGESQPGADLERAAVRCASLSTAELQAIANGT